MCQPTQRHLYCYHLTPSQVDTATAKGFPQHKISCDRRIGLNSIGKYIRELCTLAGVPNAEKATNNSLRIYGLTKLANSDGVNQTEVM